MKNIISIILLAVTMTLVAQNESDPKLESQIDSLSYFMGLSLGYDFQNLPFKADAELLIKGMEGAMKNTTGYAPQEVQMEMRKLQTAFQEQERAIAEAAAMAQQEEGNRFLEENGKREGITTTASGLQYEVLEKGDGPMPADTSEVEVHYHGTLIDGTVFDSSYDRGQSISFGLNQVIRGWTEGLQLMPVGSTYKFYIPPQLGYGGRATGKIPANSVLIFKVELLGIK